MKKYKKNMGFSREQLKEIKKGIKQDVDVSIYADPEYYPWQMRLIREGLFEGLDVRKYANPDYSYNKMLKLKKITYLHQELNFKKKIFEKIYIHLKCLCLTVSIPIIDFYMEWWDIVSVILFDFIPFIITISSCLHYTLLFCKGMMTEKQIPGLFLSLTISIYAYLRYKWGHSNTY